MAARKLIERHWAIRVGAFENSLPYFLLSPNGSDVPQLFKHRYVAEEFKAKTAREYGRDWVKYWAIVRVTVTES